MKMSSQENKSPKERKFGMPEWMLQNIERLNVTTDFEQYAYSPPETEGFLTEFSVALEQSEISSSFKTIGEKSLSNSVVKKKHVEEKKEKTDLSNLKLPLSKFDSLQKPVSPRHQSLLDTIKCDDIIYSSPDTTPYATPQASPALQRKTSFSALDTTVQSNPEKWFYLGGKEKNKLKQVGGGCDPHTHHIQTVINVHKKKYDEKHLKTKFPNRDNSKLAISNFDLNAISPSSW